MNNNYIANLRYFFKSINKNQLKFLNINFLKFIHINLTLFDLVIIK